MANQNTTQTIAVGGTFTVEPVAASVNFWMQELNIPSRLTFAPYNQVFQELLDPSSLLSVNDNGINILLVRTADWLHHLQRESPDSAFASDKAYDLRYNAAQLKRAVRQFAERSPVPLVLVFCPNPDERLVKTELRAISTDIEQQTGDELDDLSGVDVVTSTELMSLYPVSHYYDPYGDKENHVPYNPACYASIGTMIARKVFRLRSAQHKAIVLDCDQTLWKGVCAEDGPAGIEVDEARKYLQEFVRSQRDGGMLLCLCSKNSRDDVYQVFRSRSDMPLRLEHVTASRINWNQKSENIRSLAKELQTDLSSFVFIDDNPLECAEVRTHCPDVLTLQLPADPDRIPEFLNHVWAFDRARTTAEDTQRGSFYRQNLERAATQQVLGLKEFFATLDLKVRISEMRAEEFPRVAQLVERTNQFNLTTIRRSELELKRLWKSGSHNFLTVHVADRFGDYGLVGLTIFQQESNALVAETFLLSCRALGRGVEHRMLARLGEIARERALEFVAVSFVQTERNQPALDFCTSVTEAPPEKRSGATWFRLRAERAAALTHPAAGEDDPSSIRISHSDATSLRSVAKQAETPAAAAARRSEQLSRIAEQLHAPKDILAAIANGKRKQRPTTAAAFVPPEGPLDKVLAQIWSDVLGIEQPSLQDNFFALGGHSLAAVQITSMIRRDFDVDFPLRAFLEAPVLGIQARRLEEMLLVQADANELEALINEFESRG